MCVNLFFAGVSITHHGQVGATEKYTFAILVRKNDRTRNLNRSSSVCMTTRIKDVPASMREVRSSIFSIFSVPDAPRRTVSLPISFLFAVKFVWLKVTHL